MDILLLCLSKPSAFLRSLVKTVFANFAEDVDLSVAELIFSVSPRHMHTVQ